MAGFREVSRNLSYARREASNQDRVRQSYSMERTPTTSYYKSVVGTRYRGGDEYEHHSHSVCAGLARVLVASSTLSRWAGWAPSQQQGDFEGQEGRVMMDSGFQDKT